MWSSDNHMGGQMTEDELQELVETVAEAQPAPASVAGRIPEI